MLHYDYVQAFLQGRMPILSDTAVTVYVSINFQDSLCLLIIDKNE